MDPFTQILTSLGVAAPAGFNAYLALLLVGLGGRIGWIDLASPYDVLQGTAALALLAVLLTVEVIADKVPSLDSLNDVVGTVVRPIAGAVLFAGGNQVITEPMPWLSLLLGAGAAGGLHAFKAGTRPVWTLSTGGLANPVVSVFEDLVAGATVILAMLVPVLAVVVLLIVLGLAVMLLIRLRRSIRRSGGRVKVFR